MRFAADLSLVLTAILTLFSEQSAGEDTATNSVGIKLVPIRQGSFLMGSTDGDWNERPPHRVTVSKPFLIGATEVTNAQYEQFDPQHKQLRGGGSGR
jgi:formylglycine-generating enzyme required for sulfatase activity